MSFGGSTHVFPDDDPLLAAERRARVAIDNHVLRGAPTMGKSKKQLAAEAEEAAREQAAVQPPAASAPTAPPETQAVPGPPVAKDAPPIPAP